MRIPTALATIVLLLIQGFPGPPRLSAQTTAELPVREVTVFKDGHAFVLHEGAAPVDPEGSITLDHLPRPVIGTFWPYVRDDTVKLRAVTASEQEIPVERTALTLREMLEANSGAEVIVTEHGGTSYGATVVTVPSRDDDTLSEATREGGLRRTPASAGDLVLLRTVHGVRAVPISRIQDLTFREPMATKVVADEPRHVLTLDLEWPDQEAGAAPPRTATAGMVYLQKGIRWIPHYRVTVDGEGEAALELQATILNELADLDDATVHLVIGVPTFAFRDTIDPIALQEAAAELSSYFREGAQTAHAFSNAILTQTRMGEVRRRSEPTAPSPDPGPEIGDGTRSEDLWVFTVAGVTLRKGERQVLSVARFSVPYEDVFRLQVPFAPPPEVRRQFDTRQQSELAKLLHAPKVEHVLRLTNTSGQPLTTAPALVVGQGRLLGQGLMTYTASGGTSDLAVTAAVDVRVEVTGEEAGRTPDAIRWNNASYVRTDVAGSVRLQNHRDRAIRLEVSRQILGIVDAADHGGEFVQIGAHASFWKAASWTVEYPAWWHWYAWPHWWHRMNGVGEVTWTLELEPEESVDLEARWHYFWR